MASVWKGHLNFGLVTIPVRLHSAARSESISFNMLHACDHSRLKQVMFCQAEDKPVLRSDTVKGYEYEKGRYVVIEDDDIKLGQDMNCRTIARCTYGAHLDREVLDLVPRERTCA